MNPFTVTAESLTVGELAAFEEITGLTIPETVAGFQTGLAAESATFLLALILVAGSREDPGFTLEDAAAVPFTSFAEES